MGECRVQGRVVLPWTPSPALEDGRERGLTTGVKVVVSLCGDTRYSERACKGRSDGMGD